MDEFSKNIEKDIEVLEDQIQSYSLHGQYESFQKFFMPKYKENVVLPFSFEIEEECLILENQFDSKQLKSYVAKESIYELSKTAECLDDYQTNYVFYDPIANYMEEFYSPDFQLYFHFEDQLHLMFWSFQYHVYFWFKHSQEIQVSDQINEWLHWNFHVP